jgi:hypothetical protein
MMDLSAIGPSAAVVIVVIAFLKFLTAENVANNKTRKELAEAMTKNAQNTARNTTATTEMHQFLKNLNGSLKKVVDEKQEKARQ